MVRIAVISGSSGGIGLALVARFISEGYKVIGLDQTPAPALDGFISLTADLDRICIDLAYRERILKDVTDHAEGKIHVLINNAAAQIVKSTEDLSAVDWMRVMNVNLNAPFFLVQGMLGILQAAKGCVINISSIHANLKIGRAHV